MFVLLDNTCFNRVKHTLLSAFYCSTLLPVWSDCLDIKCGFDAYEPSSSFHGLSFFLFLFPVGERLFFFCLRGACSVLALHHVTLPDPRQSKLNGLIKRGRIGKDPDSHKSGLPEPAPGALLWSPDACAVSLPWARFDINFYHGAAAFLLAVIEIGHASVVIIRTPCCHWTETKPPMAEGGKAFPGKWN